MKTICNAIANTITFILTPFGIECESDYQKADRLALENWKPFEGNKHAELRERK